MWTFSPAAILCPHSSVSAVAVRRPQHRHLMGWVLTLPFYFPLGALAAYKALHEFVVSPFFWDKTQHGYASEATSRTPGHPA